MNWSSYFSVHHRQLAKLRVGRMFLAGDAAHIHSPIGGQGMNTGLQDVWNLVWKLDIACRGHASDALLESYGQERRPVIARVIGLTHAMTRTLGAANPVAQVLRDAVIPAAMRLPAIRRRMVRRLSQLDIGYAGSPIVDGAAERHFADSLRGGAGIKSRFLLLLGRAEQHSPEADALLRSFRYALELRRQDQPGVMLLRPDGYVAYSSTGAGAPDALAAARAVLTRQLTSCPEE